MKFIKLSDFFASISSLNLFSVNTKHTVLLAGLIVFSCATQKTSQSPQSREPSNEKMSRHKQFVVGLLSADKNELDDNQQAGLVEMKRALVEDDKVVAEDMELPEITKENVPEYPEVVKLFQKGSPFYSEGNAGSSESTVEDANDSIKEYVNLLYHWRLSALPRYQKENKVSYFTRDTHVKTHGCFKATFTVNKEISDASLKKGLFAQQKSYPAWIRFANGIAHDKHDFLGDARSMSIKILGTKDATLINSLDSLGVSNEQSIKTLQSLSDRKDLVHQTIKSEKGTHDFIVQNAPVFNMDKAWNAYNFFHYEQKGYAGLAKWIRYGLVAPLLQTFDYRNDIFATAILQSKVVGNLLGETYWSGTPYQLDQTAVKYVVKPCAADSASWAQLPTTQMDEEAKVLAALNKYFDKRSPAKQGNKDFKDYQMHKLIVTSSETRQLTGDLSAMFQAQQAFGKFMETKNPNSIENWNYLSKNLKSDMQKGRKACFEFGVQKYIDKENTPIDKATVVWRGAGDQLREPVVVPLAKIVLESEPEFDSPDRKQFCEGLTFNVWNVPATHKPLGQINMMRGAIYRLISTARRGPMSSKQPSLDGKPEFVDIK